MKKLMPLLGRLCYLILIPLVSTIHIYVLNKNRPGSREITTFFDNLIPFNQYFAVPYQFMVPFITIILIYFAFVNYRYYFKLLASVIMGMFICFVIFYFFPTTIKPTRDAVAVALRTDFFSNMVRDIYNGDQPYDCFPSIHVLSSYVPMLFVLKYNKSKLMNVFALLGGISIALSTMFVKQHYFLDVLVAVIMGTILFLVFTNDKLWSSMPFKNKLAVLVPKKIRNDIHSF